MRLAILVFGVAAVTDHGPHVTGAQAQETPAKTGSPRVPLLADPAQEPASVTAEAVSTRYRFVERYSPTDDPNHPEVLTQYQVGIVETQKTETETEQGAPDRAKVTHQTIYTERVAQVGKYGEMSTAVRRYDKFMMKSASTEHRPTPRSSRA